MSMENVRKYLKEVSYDQFKLDLQNGKFNQEDIFFNSDLIDNDKDFLLNRFQNGKYWLHPSYNPEYKGFLERKIILDSVEYDLIEYHDDFRVEKSYTELLINVWYKQNVWFEIRPDKLITFGNGNAVTYEINSDFYKKEIIIDLMNFIIFWQIGESPIEQNFPRVLIALNNGVNKVYVREDAQLCNELFGFAPDDLHHAFGKVEENKLVGWSNKDGAIYEFEYFPTSETTPFNVKTIEGYSLLEYHSEVQEAYHVVHSLNYMKKIISKFKKKCK